MESLLINAVAGFWILLFGAMAIVPFLLEGKPARQMPVEHDDDVVISIQPVATPNPAHRSPTRLTVPSRKPDHREAA